MSSWPTVSPLSVGTAPAPQARPQVQAPPPTDPVADWNEASAGLPEDLPDEAYNGMRNQFFNEKVIPQVLHSGFDPHDSRENFMKATERTKGSTLSLIGKSALENFLGPVSIFDDNFHEQLKQDVAEEAMKVARQGGHEKLAQFAGGVLGQAPYWTVGMGLAGKVSEALSAGPMLERAIKTAAGGLIQGSYDAASAPEGRTLVEGLGGAAMGAASAGAWEFKGPLWRFLADRGVSEEAAKHIEGVAKGQLEPNQQTVDAVLGHPRKVDDDIAQFIGKQMEATKAAGVPAQVTSKPLETGKVTAQITGADGKPYVVTTNGDTLVDFDALFNRLGDHLNKGGSVDGLSGDPRTSNQFLSAVEKVQADRFDSEVPLKMPNGQNGNVKMPLPNDTVRAKPSMDVLGLINARNSVYHATDMDGFRAILEEGQIKPAGYGEETFPLPKGSEMLEPTDEQEAAFAPEDAEVGGVSVSRVPRVASKAERAITFVIDSDKMPRMRPYVEEGYGKTIDDRPIFSDVAKEERNPQFEFENRTYDEPAPLRAVRGIIVDKEALGQDYFSSMEEYEAADKTGENYKYLIDRDLDEIRQLAAQHNIPFKTVESGKELHGYRAGLSREPPEMRWSVPLYDKLREMPDGTIEDQLTGQRFANMDDAMEGIDYSEKIASPERVRGDGVPLSTKGLAEVDQLGQDFARKGNLDSLVMTNNKRSIQTGSAILAHSPDTRVHEVTDATASWGNGDLVGAEHTPEVTDWKKDLARGWPDHPIGGVDPDSGRPGESFNQVTHRVLPYVKGLMQKFEEDPSQKIGVVTHFTPIRIVDGWLKAGAPDSFDVDVPTYLKERADPGGVYRLAPDAEGEWKLRKTNMANDQELQPGIYLIRHGETMWNKGGAIGAGMPEGEAGSIMEFKGRYKETTQGHLFAGEDIPLLGKGATAATIGAGAGNKPSIFLSNRASYEDLFHEWLHAHYDNLGISGWLNQHFSADKMVWDIYQGIFPPEAKALYQGRDIPEEVANYAFSAVGTRNDELLERMGEADTDKPTVLRWTSDTAKTILERAEEQGDSLHLRTLQRRLSLVVERSTGQLDDISRIHSVSPLELSIDRNMYTVRDGDSVYHFDNRMDALLHMDREFTEPLNAPELVDYSSLPPTPKYAMKMPAPSERPPITSDPIPPEALDEPYKAGVFTFSYFFRPKLDWFGDVSDRFDRQDLFNAFSEVNAGQIRYDNAMAPYLDVLRETLGKSKFDRQTDFFKWIQAEDAHKPFVEEELKLTPDELERLKRFKDEFVDKLSVGDFGLLRYIQDIVPKIEAAGWDVEKAMPKGQVDDLWSYLAHSARLDPRDTNLQRVSAIYLRKLMHDVYVEPALEDAEKIVGEKTADGRSQWGQLAPLMKRNIALIRGVPDFTQKAIYGAIEATVGVINQGLEKVNGYLPAGLQIPTIESTPRDLMDKYIMFSYAGALGLRPGVAIRDASQIFITSFPLLGNYMWKGMAKAFPAIKEGTESDAFKVAEKYGALISRYGMKGLVESGGDAEPGFGKIERSVESALSVQRWAHNSNRLVSFWGFQQKVEDALEGFARSGDEQQFVKDSGAWFMRPGMRDKYLKELQLASPETYDDLSKRMAKDLTEKTQWSYRTGSRPGIYDYQLGRLFGQYGTWPLNYIEWARSFMRGSDKGAATAALTRLVLAHGAVLSAGAAVGVDTSHWTFTQPMAYGGGPLFQALANIPNSFDFQTTRGADARREMKELVWPGIVPGGEEMHGVWEAISSKDPNLWVRMMGFSPLDEQDKQTGWHQLVP